MDPPRSPLIQSPPMADWFRSVTVLALAFVGAVVVTIGLANVIVPGEASGPQTAADGDDGDATPAASVPAITGIGGNLGRHRGPGGDADRDARGERGDLLARRRGGASRLPGQPAAGHLADLVGRSRVLPGPGGVHDHSRRAPRRDRCRVCPDPLRGHRRRPRRGDGQHRRARSALRSRPRRKRPAADGRQRRRRRRDLGVHRGLPLPVPREPAAPGPPTST